MKSEGKLTCPLTRKIFCRPVKLSDGHIYEEYAISEWIMEHDISPISGLQLENKNYLFNNEMEDKVSKFFMKNPDEKWRQFTIKNDEKEVEILISRIKNFHTNPPNYEFSYKSNYVVSIINYIDSIHYPDILHGLNQLHEDMMDIIIEPLIRIMFNNEFFLTNCSLLNRDFCVRFNRYEPNDEEDNIVPYQTTIYDLILEYGKTFDTIKNAINKFSNLNQCDENLIRCLLYNKNLTINDKIQILPILSHKQFSLQQKIIDSFDEYEIIDNSEKLINYILMMDPDPYISKKYNKESMSLITNKIKILASMYHLFQINVSDEIIIEKIYGLCWHKIDREENVIHVEDELMYFLNKSMDLSKYMDYKDDEDYSAKILNFALNNGLIKIMKYLLSFQPNMNITDDACICPFIYVVFEYAPLEMFIPIYEYWKENTDDRIQDYMDLIKSNKDKKRIMKWLK
jgi:hypothetical protein